MQKTVYSKLAVIRRSVDKNQDLDSFEEEEECRLVSRKIHLEQSSKPSLTSFWHLFFAHVY